MMCTLPVCLLLSLAWNAHPYRRPIIGWRSDVEQVTVEGLRHFYDTYYWPNNATVTIVGDFDQALARYHDSLARCQAAGDRLMTSRD